MEPVRPEIWKLFPQNVAAPAAFGALSLALENSSEPI